MMADHNEKPFETELCEHLAANGWLYSADSKPGSTDGHGGERWTWLAEG